MSFTLDQSLVDAVLELESGLQTLDERVRAPEAYEITDSVELVHSIYLRLTNQMREVGAALEYFAKVNRELTAFQAQASELLLEMVDSHEPGDPPE